jgi:hypothetical protein
MKNKKAELDALHIFFLLVIIVSLGLFFGFALTGKISLGGKDSDNDGLSDSRELSLGTDPNNTNTDGDRYKDGEEVKLGKDPLKVNSANIKIYLLDKSWDWSSVIVNTISLVLKMGSLSSDTVIADTYVKILVKNEGDDYSEYVNYDLVYEVSGNELRSIPNSLGMIKEGEEKTLVYEEKILLKDVPKLLLNSISNWNAKWDIKVENLNYRRFN